MKKLFNVINIIMIVLGIVIIFVNHKLPKEVIEEAKIDISSYYSKYVETNNTKLYKKETDEFKLIGEIGDDIVLTLDGIDQEYFKILNMDYYVSYKEVIKLRVHRKENENQYYKNYVPFNENIITNNTNLYNENGLIYNIDESMSLPIIIKEIDKYYVTYNDKLFYVKSEDVKEIVYNLNTDREIANSIGVLNYHFFYDKSLGETCNQVICLEKTKFVEQLDYLKNNNYFTLKLSDLEMFIDGKINIPKNSVVITIDDGAMGVASIAKTLLEEYKFNGTLFLISAWNDKDDFKSDYLELHSHGHDLHNQGVCSEGNQGGAIQCMNKEKLLEDLNYSKNLLNSTYFAYPFYEYNDYSISVLKETGFTMAFVGGNSKVKRNSNKFILPRYVVLNNNDINDFIGYIK